MNNNTPVLYIFSGLPAVGKTTLAQMLARHTKALYLRIDTVEQGLRDLCHVHVQGEGYRLSYRVADDNLRLGNDVIADSCNPIELTRKEWQQVAKDSKATFVDIEVICSNVTEHRDRAETRDSTIKGLVLPKWEQIKSREYHNWSDNIIQIDTANKSQETAFQELLQKIERYKPRQRTKTSS